MFNDDNLGSPSLPWGLSLETTGFPISAIHWLTVTILWDFPHPCLISTYIVIVQVLFRQPLKFQDATPGSLAFRIFLFKVWETPSKLLVRDPRDSQNNRLLPLPFVVSLSLNVRLNVLPNYVQDSNNSILMLKATKRQELHNCLFSRHVQ